MFRVRLDGLDDQVQFVRAVDLSRYAVIAVWRDLQGFSEVVQAIDPVRGDIFHKEHGAGAIFRPRDQGKMIGAEVKHEVAKGRKLRPPAAAPLRGYPADSSVRDITTARRFLETGESIRRWIRILVGFAQTVAAKQKDLRVFDKTIGNGSSNGRIEKDVAPVGKRSIRCDDCTSLAAVAR